MAVKPSQLKVVIFDLDGTLVEFPRDFLFGHTERVMGNLGLPLIGREAMEAAFSAFDFFSFIEAERREWFLGEYWKAVAALPLPPPQELTGALEVVSALASRGIKLAVATARSCCAIKLREELRTHTRLEPHLCHISVRDPQRTDEWHDKTVQIEEVLRACGARPEEAILVGDIPPDIESARRAGLRSAIGVLSGGIDSRVLLRANPCHLIDDVRGLLHLLD